MSTATAPLGVAEHLNQLEGYFFFGRQVGEATGRGYIASNTWRGFRSAPRTPGIISAALISAFDFITAPFDQFIRDRSRLTRSDFDAFHAKQVDDLFHYLQSSKKGVVVAAAAAGEFHGLAYNSYAKVVNLAHTHWCFRRHPKTGGPQYPPSEHVELRHCLHVPLDKQVTQGVNNMIAQGLLPPFPLPIGGMGSIRSRSQYIEIQDYLRGIADKVDSTNFRHSKVSVLAFEGHWE